MFKIGEKVVFVGGLVSDFGCILPSINEIVTIDGYSTDYEDHYHLLEYKISIFDDTQHFSHIELRKLKDVFDEQSEEILENILKLKLEPELV